MAVISGNLIVIIGTTLAIVGLTFGGAQFPWISAQVLAPLIIGLLLIGVFLLYEVKVPIEPTIPWALVSNRTSLGGWVFVKFGSVLFDPHETLAT